MKPRCVCGGDDHFGDHCHHCKNCAGYQERDRMCSHCGMAVAIRNPSGYCDHLYYPDNCPTCAGYQEVTG
jgi:hypothetical protein